MHLRPISSVLVLALGATLAGCAPAWYSADGCTPQFAPGFASNSIDVSEGIATETPFEAPLATDETQVSLHGGEGDPAGEGDVVVTDFALFDAATGQVVQTSSADIAAANRVQQATQLVERVGGDSVLSEALSCARDGGSVAVASTYGGLFGDENVASSGINPASSVVVIFDVVDTFAGRAEGMPQPGVAGMPSLANAPDGRPGITFPGSPAPTDLQVVTTIQGSGAEVAADDTVVIQYTLVEWDGTSPKETTWDGRPATLSLTETVPGFQRALEGQKVGSQVMAAVPPELAYDDGVTLLFVIDILDVVEP